MAHRGFRRLWAGHALSLLGSQIGRIGLLLYVVRESGEVAAVAALVAVETLPGALAAPFAGAWIDRLGPRPWMVLADLVRAACVLGILLSPTPPVILPLMAITSVANVVFQSAKGASIPRLVPVADLPSANAVDRGASSVMWILGPVAGATLLTTLGLAPTLWIDAASFLVSAILVSAIGLGPARADARAAHARAANVGAADARAAHAGAADAGAADPAEPGAVVPTPVATPGAAPAAAPAGLLEGWRFLRQERRVLLLNGQLFVALVCTGLWLPLAPFFLRDHLGAPEPALGWQIGLFGAGSLLGALAAPRIVEWLGQGKTVLAGLVAEAGVMCLYALVPELYLSTGVLFLWGMAVSVVAVPFQSLCQALVDEQFLGRVFAIVQQVESLALLLATLLAVALHRLWPSPRIFLVAGLVYLAAAAFSATTRAGRALLATP